MNDEMVINFLKQYIKEVEDMVNDGDTVDEEILEFTKMYKYILERFKVFDELRKIIIRYDELVDMWFSGERASVLSAGGENVYEEADKLRESAFGLLNSQ